MPKVDPRVDAYIAKTAEFARPILTHLRTLVHQACPDVEETIKWNMPSFTYKGLLCGMAAFKNHAVFGFWKHDLVVGKDGEKEGMGQFGKITTVKDLPSDKMLLGYIRKAVALNEAGTPARPRPSKPKVKPEITVPDFFAAALKKNKTAQSNFENFSYSHKKEYVEWLTEAKRPETRDRRLQTALAWIAEGKSQNWRYERC